MMGFYADSIMLLALGGAASLVMYAPLWGMLVVLAASLGACFIPPLAGPWLAASTLVLLTVYSCTLAPVLGYLSALLATVSATLITKSAAGKGLAAIEACLWLLSLIVFPLVRARSLRASTLQLLLLCMVLLVGLIISSRQDARESPKGVALPLGLVLPLFWLLFH